MKGWCIIGQYKAAVTRASVRQMTAESCLLVGLAVNMIESGQLFKNSMGFPKRMAGLIQFQQFLVLGGDFFLSGGLGQLAGYLRGDNGVWESAGFRIGGGERGEKSGLLVFGQFTGAFGQLNGFGAGAESGVGSGGKNPRQFVERVGKVRLETQRLAVMRNGFL